MDKMPLISLLLYSIPEEFLLFTFGLVILGQKVHFPKVFVTSVLAAIGTYFIRLLPLPFGFNAIISVALFILLFMILLKRNLKQAFLATILSASTLLALENMISLLIEMYLGLPLEEIWQYPLLRTFMGWPNLLLFSFIIWLIYKKKIQLNI